MKSDRNDRRILTFPAVHPCEGISAATLLGSLIALSRNICSFKSKFFPTQRRNARETIRQIGILLIFFEEIRDHFPGISESIVLCLSELHITFQNIHFLLEDCTREGAKLWILMKALSVATQFRVLIRSVATALDVLPLQSIGVSGEIKELVLMVANQAQRGRMELDSDDEKAMKWVILILNQFENRLEPDPLLIRKVLDYIGVTNWGECNKEIKLLEEEISVECSENHGREVPLLSSLVGFMSYCRGALFLDSCYGRNIDDQSEGMNSTETVSCLNPEDFRCPISLELMTDPVTVSTGQTYDRASIQKWLSSGNLLCPKTGKTLTSTELIPNSSLRKLIQQFCSDNGISLSKSRKTSCDISRTIVPGSPAAAEAIKFLSEFLARRLRSGSDEQRNKAAYEIRLLAKSNIYNRCCLINAGAIPPLLHLLSSADPSTQENAISALLKLSKHTNGKTTIVEHGGVNPIVEVLKNGAKLEAKQIAAAIIFYLSSTREHRKQIGDTPGLIEALIELMKIGTPCGKKNAIVAIFALVLNHRTNHQKILSTNAIEILVNLLSSPQKEDLTTDALAVLATLADTKQGSTAALQASALPVISTKLQTVSSRPGKEYCVSILLSLCTHCGGDVTAVLARDQSLMPRLYPLVSEGTAQARKKARLLIRILHKFCESSSSTLPREIAQEQFIGVR
ncbi:PREDICTED: U-box domain-containing protein 19-like [Ipomoea nil]|uniref:U-box domain-containing protein 19-like n=1 Tax=Ipomoea nil TaxID=35883 RepID=UPI000900FE4C|nr:PREDICTED: U-box domain-containing protein 19-like [Ipomoea nil]